MENYGYKGVPGPPNSARVEDVYKRQEIMLLYNYKKHVLDYQFHPFIWDVGGKYVWPLDQDKLQYHYRRGFEDCFTEEPNVPFRSIL